MPFVGGDDFRECCDCCSLGVIAKANNDTTCSAERFPAMLLSNSSIQCIKTFKQCCKGKVNFPIIRRALKDGNVFAKFLDEIAI